MISSDCRRRDLRTHTDTCIWANRYIHAVVYTTAVCLIGVGVRWWECLNIHWIVLQIRRMYLITILFLGERIFFCICFRQLLRNSHFTNWQSSRFRPKRFRWFHGLLLIILFCLLENFPINAIQCAIPSMRIFDAIALGIKQRFACTI